MRDLIKTTRMDAWQLRSNNMDILQLLAPNSEDAEKQLTLLGISMTWAQGTFKVSGSADRYYLSVHGAFSYANHYELRKVGQPKTV